MKEPRTDAFEFEPGDVHRCMGGDYWTVSARLYNFDAKEISHHGPGPYDTRDVTREWHRREYELSSLDPSTLGTETWRVSEADLISHFDNEATAEESREHYRSQTPEKA